MRRRDDAIIMRQMVFENHRAIHQSYRSTNVIIRCANNYRWLGDTCAIHFAALKDVFVPFVDGASHLCVHFAEFLARKGRNRRKTWARRASDISMQKHLAASILAAYFPAAFEPSPLVSNVSSPVLPHLRLAVLSLFLAANNQRVSCIGKKEKSVKTLHSLYGPEWIFWYFRSNVFLLHMMNELLQVQCMNTTHRLTITIILILITLISSSSINSHWFFLTYLFIY